MPINKDPIKIAITGTKGKTTILSLLENAILSLETGSKVIASSSTEGMFYNRKFIRKADNRKYLSDKDETGDKLEYGYFVSEATSFMLYIGAYTNHIPTIAIYTGIEDKEHLDVHYTFENYLNSKKILFDLLKNDCIAIINSDDEYSDFIVKNCQAKYIIKYGFSSNANYTTSVKDINYQTMTSLIRNHDRKFEINSKLLGKYNALNILAVYITLCQLGFSHDAVVENISAFMGVPGRYERYILPGNRVIIIDYAHTPGSLQKVIELTKELYSNKKLVVLFGCGGGRSKEKRPIMGKISTENSDYVYLTSDNPRSENPLSIIEEIKSGMSKDNFEIIVDRKEAVLKAIDKNENAVILIAGKGSESQTYRATFDVNANCNHCGKEMNIKLDYPIPKVKNESDFDLLSNAALELKIPVFKSKLYL
jgi:UDP-N-acetylmuramoyl-L-alanyl-D-glutamate--2,6-diaminopimelate ligase